MAGNRRRQALLAVVLMAAMALMGCDINHIIVEGSGNQVGDNRHDYDEKSPSSSTASESSEDEEIKKYSDEVNALLNDEDYENAIKKANEALEEYPNVTALSDLKQRAMTGYEDQILSKTNKALKQNDYDEALETVNSALDALANMNESSDKLEKKKTKIQNNMPTKLCDLPISEGNDRYRQITEQVVMKDTVGNKHSPGNLFRIESSEYEEYSGYAKYYLNKQYKKLSFTVAVSEEEPDQKDTATLAIYGDDDQILYSWDDVGRATAPVDVDLVDVENQEWISIRAQSKEYKGVIFLLDNPQLFR